MKPTLLHSWNKAQDTDILKFSLVGCFCPRRMRNPDSDFDRAIEPVKNFTVFCTTAPNTKAFQYDHFAALFII